VKKKDKRTPRERRENGKIRKRPTMQEDVFVHHLAELADGSARRSAAPAEFSFESFPIKREIGCI
jgi:hypothetical protein